MLCPLCKNGLREATNIPSRLLAAEDEFFKQLNYRAEVKSGLYDEAVRPRTQGR